jgi:predicted N-formylglutamate amidohydrolase
MRFNRRAKLLQDLEENPKFLATLFEIDAVQACFWTADLSHSNRVSRHDALLRPFWRNVENAIFRAEDDKRAAVCQFGMIPLGQGNSKVWDGTVENRHAASFEL